MKRALHLLEYFSSYIFDKDFYTVLTRASGCSMQSKEGYLAIAITTLLGGYHHFPSLQMHGWGPRLVQ